MNNNTHLVDILYSETIEEYVIILKRFPDMPVILLYPDDINSIIDLVYCDDEEHDAIIFDFIDENKIIYNALKLSKKNECSTIYHSEDGKLTYEEKITDLERNEIINKLLEIYEGNDND